MRSLLPFLAAFLFVVPASGQEKEKEPAGTTAKYTNDELGISFSGVYGWERDFAEGSGAWTLLAEYRSDRSLDSSVKLLVRDNPYEATNDLRRALEAEFKVGEIYKEVTFTDAAMKKGIQLPAIQVEAVRVEVKDAKKRERTMVVRTYFGKNRLFRVQCEARRARAKKVRDLFDRAMAGLIVKAVDEATVAGAPVYSQRGKYSCVVPEGFMAVLPAKAGATDFRFESRRLGVTVSVISYAYNGTLPDQVEEMVDYYNDAIKMENEDAKVLGGDGFVATITRGENVTLVTGTVQHDRCYRVHTKAHKSKLEDAKRVHATFQKGFKVAR